MWNFWKKRVRQYREKIDQVKNVRVAYQIGNQPTAYNIGVLDGIELALAIMEDRELNLQISIKK